ncbi:exocyst complex component EXO70A1-like [Punica granatum]|uniref:Exocyst subunit Exo70 family protein n=1 Tax=Punica granatum TaxID=22663 RepID=A0A6P8EC01_PUNGR|nr:exocyst complex component EXO70A1-like [Punica granatum]
MASRLVDDSAVGNLELARTDLKALLLASKKADRSLEKMDLRFGQIDEALSTASRRVAPLQSQAIANKALDTRINRAITPALALLDSFRVFESLQDRLLDLSSKLSSDSSPRKRLRQLLRYVGSVEKLNEAIDSIARDGGPAVQKLQEVVEFLSRTKATDQFRTHRLRETMVTLKALYETEVDAMRFEGLLDEALLNLQDEFESMLMQLKHQNIGEISNGEEQTGGEVASHLDLGTEQEIEVLSMISETLTGNDCLDICIDIFVKVRYRRAAKALMKLNPEYLKTYSPEEIDEMEWENLETAIALWIQHFELALKIVFVAEKKLCSQVLGGIMEGLIWPECFVKIADKIMAVFFRFGEGVARSKKEPQKLFKLLDMFNSLEKLKPEFSSIFDGEAGADICTRFRELEKLLVHASSKVFWEFGLQIEGNSEGSAAPQNGSVPKLVRYAINYLKYLASHNYNAPMAQVLRTEQIWRQGILSKQESDENLLKDAILNVMEALQRNVESKRSQYRDKILAHVFAMNTYWYIYMRTRNTELGRLLGDQYMKRQNKVVAEESAYMYQKQAWGPLMRLLEREDNLNMKRPIREAARGKMEAFLKGFEEISQMHRSSYIIPEADLREQIKEATLKLVIPAYADFIDSYASVLEGTSYVTPESLEGLLGQIFDGGDRREVDGSKLKRRDSRDSRRLGGNPVGPMERDVKDYRRSRSNASEL